MNQKKVMNKILIYNNDKYSEEMGSLVNRIININKSSTK